MDDTTNFENRKRYLFAELVGATNVRQIASPPNIIIALRPAGRRLQSSVFTVSQKRARAVESFGNLDKSKRNEISRGQTKALLGEQFIYSCDFL